MSTEHPFTRPFQPFRSLAKLPPTRIDAASWPIPDVLPPGLTLLTGESYSGKTSLAYQLALCAAQGRSAFHEDDETERPPRHVLFLGLDSSSDHLGSLAQRYLDLHPETALPEQMYVTNTWKELTPEEGLAELQAEFDSHPDVCLFVIDNLANLRTLFRGNDRKLFALLRSLAEQRGIGILLLHSAKASTPLVTYVDHHLHLKRLAISCYYHLDAVGHLLAPTAYQLYCPSNGIDFQLVNRDEEYALATHGGQRMPTPERMALLSVFEICDKEVLTPSQIAAALDLDEYSVKHILGKMLRAHLLISPARQRYALSPSIKPLLRALFDQYPFLPDFAVEELPPPTEAEMKALEEKAPKKRTPTPSAENEPMPDTSAAQRHPSRNQAAHSGNG